MTYNTYKNKIARNFNNHGTDYVIDAKNTVYYFLYRCAIPYTYRKCKPVAMDTTGVKMLRVSFYATKFINNGINDTPSVSSVIEQYKRNQQFRNSHTGN